MSAPHPRLGREQRTVAAMVRIYCRRHHQAEKELGADCEALVRYAHRRLDRCPFQADKPTCANCPMF